MNSKFSKNTLYIVTIVSPLLLLPACAPLDWIKSKLGSEPKPVAQSEKTATINIDTKDWVVKINDKVAVVGKDFKQEFEMLLQEKPQLKSMLPLMPNLEKDFAKGLAQQAVISEYIAKNGLDKTAEYQKKLARAQKAVKTMLNIDAFNKSLGEVTMTDAELKDFYEENKDQIEGILMSHGGVSAVGVSFNSEDKAKAFLSIVKKMGKNVDIQAVAKSEAPNAKIQDFKLVHQRSLGIDPLVKNKIVAFKSCPTFEIVKGSDKNFWVVYASKKEDAKYRPFAEIKDGLAQAAKQQKQGKKANQQLESLMQKYNVNINEDYFSKSKGLNKQVNLSALNVEKNAESELDIKAIAKSA